MDSEDPPFKELLRQCRLNAGLTQEELAERAGLSLRGVNALERGERSRPHRDTVRLLADALGLSTWDRSRLEASARGRPAPVSPLSPPRDADTGSATMSQVPFVGRRRELEMLAQHLAGYGPRVLMLAGAPGIGKTRLLAQVGEKAEGAGLRVLRGGCQRHSGQEPYAPMGEALSRHIRSRPAGEMHEVLKGAQWLVRMLPELTPIMPGAQPPASAPGGQERRLIFGAVTQAFENITRDADALLLLDDLQWASDDALDVLAGLATDPASTHLRIIGAYRETEAQPGDSLSLMLADLAQAGAVWQHAIMPLDPPEAQELLASLLDTVHVPDEDRTQWIVRQTGGVPFFLVSYAQQARIALAAGEQPDEVPWNIAHSVRQRVAALPALTQDLIQIAAAVGRRTSRTLLYTVCEKPEPDVFAALDTACRAQLLVYERDESYRFVHDVIREVVEGDIGAARRAMLHGTIARALEQRGERSVVEDLAYHYARSDDQDRALFYLQQAADRARRAGAHRQEAALLAQALDLAERGGHSDRVVALRWARGQALAAMSSWAGAAGEIETALQKLPVEHAEARIEMLIDLSEVSTWVAGVPTARRHAAEALALAERLGRDDLSARALGMLAEADCAEGDLVQSLRRLDQAFARAGSEHRPSHASDLELSGLIYYWTGDFAHAVEREREAVVAGRESQNTRAIARALPNLAAALVGLGRYGEALETYSEARAFARDHDTGGIVARTIAMEGGLHLELSSFATAEDLAEEAREVSRSSEWARPGDMAGIDLLLNFARSGRVGRADALIPDVTKGVADATGAHAWVLRMRLAEARAEIALARAKWDEAIRWSEDVLQQSGQTGRVKYQALGLETRAKALTSLGRQHEAIADLRRAVEVVRPVGDPLMFLRAAAPLLAVDGEDAILAEAHAAVDRIIAAVPRGTLLHSFLKAEPTQVIHS